MQGTPIARRMAWQRELSHYPPARICIWYLIVTLATAVTLYSHIFVAVSVLPLLQRELGFSLQQFGLFFTLVFLVSAVSSLFGSLSDRLGRANLVVYGSIASALLTLGVALTGTTWSFFIAGGCLPFSKGCSRSRCWRWCAISRRACRVPLPLGFSASGRGVARSWRRSSPA